MPTNKTILISSQRISETTEIAAILVACGHQVHTAASASEAMELARRSERDLILVDVCGDDDPWSLLRAFSSGAPVVAMGSSASADQRVAAFELGADEFLPLPMDAQELRLRVGKSLARWAGRRAGANLRFDRCRLNLLDQTVTCDGRTRTNLTPSEFGALRLLMENSGRYVSRSEISTAVLRRPYARTSRAVDMLVSKLRSKIRTHKGETFITSVRGAGYAVDPLALRKTAQRGGPTRIN